MRFAHVLVALPPLKLDALIGLACFAGFLGEVALFPQDDAVGWPYVVALAAVVATGVALRRVAPLAAVVLADGGLAAGVQTGEDVGLALFCVLLVNFTAGLRLGGARLGLAFVLAAAGVLTGILLDDFPDQPSNFFFSVTFGAAAPMLFGQLLRNRARLNRALRENAARAEQEQSARAEAAALEERTRIAGELHDVVAHALSAMTVQASGARRFVDRDPERTAAAFAAVEDTGREALGELRRLLGVLRREDEDIGLAPQPSLAHLTSLARRARDAGLPTALTVHGAARPLPAGVDLTAYRVVQEALARARDHGHAGRASVRVDYLPAAVAVEVVDDGAAEDRRLLGMRERVALYGGEFSAGAQAGGWRVRAQLPAEGPA